MGEAALLGLEGGPAALLSGCCNVPCPALVAPHRPAPLQSPLRDDAAAATSQLVSVARKAQHLRRQQQEIERQVTER